MKLNHLILVICTGILVGFSACKKDPFTEKDAIEAQKELITLKAGYDLALKNVELAIQKAHDEAAIAITKLQTQGASDLSKQQAQQDAAKALLELEIMKREILFQDSLDKANLLMAAQAMSFYSMVMNRNGSPFLTGQWEIRENDKKTLLPGSTVKYMPADKTTFVTLTANSEGFVRYQNALVYPTQRLYVEGVSSASKKFALQIYRAEDAFNYDNLYLYSYDPTNVLKVSGKLYAAFDLTNNTTENAGAARLISANADFRTYGGFKNDSGKAVIEFAATTDASGVYTLKLPNNTDNAVTGYDLLFPKEITGYQKAYTNWKSGDNQFQTLPTIVDSLAVTLKPGVGSYVDVTNYYLTLPDEDGEGYSMTLTDPLKIIAQYVNDNYGDDTRLPDGTTENETNTLSSGFSIDVDGFVLNNGWFKVQPSDNDGNQYVYDVPQVITTDSTNIKAYLNGTQGYRDTIYLTYLADFVNSGGNPSAVWTPALEYDTTYTVDTLAVDLVDMSGAFVDEAPELSVTIDINGALESIIFEEDASTGLFNIDAVLAVNSTFDGGWLKALTNRQPKSSKIASGNWTDDYTYRLGHIEEATTVNFYYGVVKAGSALPNGYGSDADAYDPSDYHTWNNWGW